MAYRQMKEGEALMANSEWSEGGFLPLPPAIGHMLLVALLSAISH